MGRLIQRATKRNVLGIRQVRIAVAVKAALLEQLRAAALFLRHACQATAGYLAPTGCPVPVCVTGAARDMRAAKNSPHTSASPRSWQPMHRAMHASATTS
jgi:hypothetical protein